MEEVAVKESVPLGKFHRQILVLAQKLLTTLLEQHVVPRNLLLSNSQVP